MDKRLKVKRRRSKRSPEWTKELEDELMEALERGATATDVIKASAFSFRQVTARRKEDPEFAQRWDDAIKMGDMVIEDEVKSRAVDGWLEPVYHEGRVVGRKRKKSDILLMFLAKKRMPEFRDNYTVNANMNHQFEGAKESLAAKMNSILDMLPAPKDGDEDADE